MKDRIEIQRDGLADSEVLVLYCLFTKFRYPVSCDLVEQRGNIETSSSGGGGGGGRGGDSSNVASEQSAR